MLVALGILVAFVALNYTAYDGFFQDDELDTLSWAPSRHLSEFASGLVKPTFDADNFRPPGHFYFYLAGRAFGMDFPPYMTPILALHLINVAMLWLLLRKLNVQMNAALAGAAFFALSAAAMDAYWKPMYVYDLLCATFSLSCILLWIYRRWILSFLAFWLAYKSKEVAVMLPAILLIYERWLGEKRYLPLIPFFAASLSFGVQGILLNPNKDNDYTFRFTLRALKATIPFYSKRVFGFSLSGVALFALVLIRDRRIWFGLLAALLFLFPLLFLPGRLFEAYLYLPLAGAVIAMSSAASRCNPACAWIFIALWMPWNYRQLHREQKAKLAADDEAFAYVDQMQRWAGAHPQVRTLVYTAAPRVYHDWGVTAAWNIAHGAGGLRALYFGWPQTAQVLREETVAYAKWNPATRVLVIQIHSPDQGRQTDTNR